MIDRHADDVRIAIGDVTLAASNLELQIAQLVRRALGKPWTYARTLASKVGAPMRELNNLINETEPNDLRTQLLDLKNAAEACLQERHAVVHSITARILSASGEDLGSALYDPKHDTYELANREKLVDLRDRLESLATDARRIRESNFGPPPDRLPWPSPGSLAIHAAGGSASRPSG